MKLVMAASTDVGSVRETNEDFFYYSKSSQLVVVCDGMGGHQSGAVASRIAGKTMRDVFSHSDFAELARLGVDVVDRLPPLALRLLVGARLANYRLRAMAERDRNLRGMGTTMVALAFGENTAYAIHIGDSRLYCLRNKSLYQITEDHSLVNQLLQDRDIRQDEVKHFRKKNVLTRALGAHPVIKVDVQWFPVRNADVFLLCTDGLHNALDHREIETLLPRHAEDLQMMADTLVQEAKAANGNDNITAVVASVAEVPTPPETKERVQVTVPEESPKTLAFEDKFINEKYPLNKSERRSLHIKSKWVLFAIFGVMLVAALGYGISKRSLLSKYWNRGVLVASPDITVTGLAERDDEIKTTGAKTVDGYFVFLHVSNPRQLELLRNRSGVRLLDQFDAAEFHQGNSGDLKRPIMAGGYSLVLVDSLQRIVYRKDGIRIGTSTVHEDTTTESARAANGATTPLQMEMTTSASDSPTHYGNTIRDVGEVDTPLVRQPSLENRTQLKNGGQIYLQGLQNPEYRENDIFANNVLIGKVKQVIEKGFWLRSGNYRIMVRDSTGRVLYQKENVVVENGDVKLIEFTTR